MKKTLPVIVIAIYSILVAIGGIIGYLKAGSLPSLLMGLAFGGALGFNAYGMLKGCGYAHKISTVLTAILGAFFGYRFYLSHAFMPAGLMLILSGVTLIVLLSTCCCNKEACKN